MSYRSSLKSAGSVASKIIIATFFLSLFIFNSCDEEAGFLGRNLLPPTDDLFTRFNDQTILSSRSSFGKPILSYDPGCRGARAYESLTKELIDRHRHKLKERELKKEIEPLSNKRKVFWDTGAAPRHAASRKK